MNELLSVSPIDGRYAKYTSELKNYFSEYSLFKYRLLIELKYLIAFLTVIRPNKIYNFISKKINNIYEDFTVEECLKIKHLENKINHDVKAVEYYIKNKFEMIGLKEFGNFVHFGLTSQDINNTAIPLSIKEFTEDIYYKLTNNILRDLDSKSDKWKEIIFITRTHGQPATPSTFGKEIKVFSYRIKKQYEILKNIKYWSKFGGSTGHFNAHKLAYPKINWIDFSNKLIENLGLHRNKYTTQIDNYENLSNYFDCVKRINLILIDLCRDIWYYISMEYFTLKINKNEVGSSTMPHKINPINFENAEGNLMLTNSILEFMSRKLPISRLQRDLTDSTILRNLGSVFGYILIAFKNIISGLNKIDINKNKIEKDKKKYYVVISEGIQTILRKYNYSNAYEKLKNITRTNNYLTKKNLDDFIINLECSGKIKNKLLKISVDNYIGYSDMSIIQN